MSSKIRLTESALVDLIKRILVEQTQPAAQPATQPATQPAAQPATQPAAQPAATSGNKLEYTPPKTGELAKLLKPYPLDLFDKQGKLVRKIMLTNFAYGNGSNVAFNYQVKRKNGSTKKGTIEVFCSSDNTILDRAHQLKYFYNDNFIKQLPHYCFGVNSARI